MRRSILMLSSVVTLFLAGCSKSPESTLESFYYAVDKGEIAEAQTYFSSQVTGMLGAQKLAATLADASRASAQCGGVKSVTVNLTGQGEVRSGNATVTYSGNCQPKTERVKLIKEDGKWKIGAEK